jgi:hypothetical protein
MTRTHTAQAFLTGVFLLPVGWYLAVPLGGRSAYQEYRNDEDLYTMLSLAGGVLILLGLVLITVSIFRALRKVDKNSFNGPSTPSTPAIPLSRDHTHR